LGKAEQGKMFISPEWVEAGAAVALALLTLLTLIVLKGYADDTETIAKASVEQIENSQKPFVALALRKQEAEFPGGWVVVNIGFGPAVNVRYSNPDEPSVLDHNTTIFGKDHFYHLKRFNIDTIRPHGFNIEYQSLSGKKYRTAIIWVDGAMQTTFHGPL
jgi:hypothetical protein